MARPPTVKTLSRIIGVAGGGDEGRRIEGQHRRRRQGKPKSKPSRRLPSWRGGRQEAKTHTKRKGGTTHSPARGKVPSRTRISKEKTKQRAPKRKETKHTVLCYCVSSQLTLAAPRLGAEEGVGRTAKKENEHEKPTVPCLSLAARLPGPWPSTERGVGRTGEKANKQTKETTPGPALSGGGR